MDDAPGWIAWYIEGGHRRIGTAGGLTNGNCGPAGHVHVTCPKQRSQRFGCCAQRNTPPCDHGVESCCHHPAVAVPVTAGRRSLMRELVRLEKRYTDPREKDKPPDKRRHFDWMLRWVDPDGRKRSETVARSSEPNHRRRAETAWRTKWREMEDGVLDEPADTPFDEFVTEHLKTLKGQIRATSILDIGSTLKVFKNEMKPRALQDVDFSMAERFMNRVAAGRSKATLNKFRRNLVRVWNLAVNRGLVEENPWSRIRPLKAAARDRVWFRPEQFNKMLAGAPSEYWRTFMYVAYVTGLRVGELSRLRWIDVVLEPDAGRVIVRPHKADGLVLPWEPKDTDRRDVPLDKRAVALLAARQSDVHLTSPYVFVSAKRLATIRHAIDRGEWKPTRRWVRNYNVALDQMKLSAEIDVGCFHDLRVSAICNWLAAGVNPHEVQKLAGHADLTTTMAHYALVDESALDRARDAVERIASSIRAG